jgi:hypothetical protein
MHQNIAPDALLAHSDAVVRINRMMEEKAGLHQLNEGVLVKLLNRLEEDAFVCDTLYWLSLARINELAVLCAENYARNCEVTLVGDLLVNPRLVLVHVRGAGQPVVKKRHARLTDQFSRKGASRESVIQWLKRHTIVENRTDALLPDLLRRLKDSELFCDAYVDSVENRLKRIADLTAYLACRQFESGTDLEKWLQGGDAEDQHLVRAMCRPLDFNLFWRLGDHVSQTACNPHYESCFLIPNSDAAIWTGHFDLFLEK